MPKNLQNCHTYRKIVTPFFGQMMYLCAQNSFTNRTLMDELTRFIAETPLWLTIIFFAVFAAMWIWFFVLLWQTLRGKFFSE